MCNIINVFTVTFDQYNSSVMNKSINFLSTQTFDPEPIHNQCRGKILLKVMRYNITLLSKKVTNYDT